MNRGRVVLCVVTWNHESCIEACLESCLQQTAQDVGVIVVDNNSHDGTRAILAKYAQKVVAILNGENRGFCGANNQAIRLSKSEFVLLVNPDVVLESDFVERGVAAISDDAKAGALCGLLLLGEKGDQECRVDGTGLSICRSRRMVLRDHGIRLKDLRREAGEVFGVDGALALYRREMIDDVANGGEFFDEMYFAHKEVWDVAWRARLLGWKALFEPRCVAWHRRGFKPGNLAVRRTRETSVKMHAVKNDVITIIKNEDALSFARDWVCIVGRQLAILVYVLCCERTSLRAYALVWANAKSIVSKRRVSKARQRVGVMEALKLGRC